MNNFYESICADAIKVELNYGEKNKDDIFGQPSVAGKYKVTIHNARKQKNTPKLDREGFCKVAENSGFNDFTNQDKIRDIYFPIVSEIIKKQLEHIYQIKNCEVNIFNYLIRNESSKDPSSLLNRTPIELIHADYSTARLDEFYANISDDFLFKNFCVNHKDMIGTKSWGLFNVWKPLNLIINSNLALCAKTSLNEKDIYRNKNYHHTLDQVSRLSSLNYRKTQRWFYYPLIQPNEVIIFEQYKNDLGFNDFIPVFHTAFAIDKSLYGYAPRQNIEFRVLAVWD